MAIGKEIDKFVSTFLATYKTMGEEDRAERKLKLAEQNAKGMSPEEFAKYIQSFSAGGGGGGGNGKGGNGGGTGKAAPSTEVETYVREAAGKRGIDPDVAVRVFKAESGLNINAKNLTSKEQSYGVAQLNMKGGLGVEAARQGIDVRDPSTWRRQIDFSLDVVKKDGWRQWYGARNVGIARWQGIDPNFKPPEGSQQRPATAKTPAPQEAAVPLPPTRPENPAPAEAKAEASAPSAAPPATAPAALPTMTLQPLPRTSSNDTEPANEQTAQAEPDADQALPMDDTQYAAAGGMIEPSHDEALGAALHDVQSSIGSSNAALPGSDPEHAQRVQAFHNDAGAVSPEAYDALMKAVNPDGMNANAVRDAMNKIYGFYASKGDRAAASKAAGGVLQAARARSREYGKMAGDALQQRNYPLAARALMASYNEMPDGKRITAEVNEQGEGRAVVYDNDTDKPVEQFPLNPKVLGMATMRAMAGGDFYYMLAQQTAPRSRGRSPVNAG